MKKCLKKDSIIGTVVITVLSVISIILFALNGFGGAGFKSTEVIPQDIENIKVVETIKEGNTIFKA